jgi:hypothetical protein
VRHRVVDIGLVVNRALVFATVSGIVLLAFAVLEWLLGNVLVTATWADGVVPQPAGSLLGQGE